MLKLQILDEYYRSRRRRGHTTAVLEGAANNNNIRVIVGVNGQISNINLPSKQLIPVGEMERLRGCRFPVVVDNFAINIMWEEVNDELTKKDNEIAMLKGELYEIAAIAKNAIRGEER